MANTKNTRDVTLRFLIETLGQENVDKLRQALNELGEQGDASATETKALVDEIERLAEQSRAVQSVRSLGDAVKALQDQEGAAAGALNATTDALTKQKVAVDEARQSQEKARQTLLDARQASVDAGTAIKLLRTEYDAAGKKTEQYQQELRKLTTAQGEQAKAVLDAGNALTQATRQVNAAVASQERLETSQERATKAAQAAADAVAAQDRTFTEARTAAQALGVDVDNLATAEQALARAATAAAATAAERTASLREMAAADRLLAIEEQAMVELLQRGAQALRAEELAQVDATQAIRDHVRATEQAQAAAQARVAATREMAEADRLLIIQERAMAELFQRGADALKAEEAAQRDAARAIKDTAQAAQQATAAIDQAFSTVGVRSVDSLKAEIDQVRAAMTALQTSGAATGSALRAAFAAGEGKIKELEREIRAVTNQLTLADRAADLLKNSLGQIAAGNIIADGVGYLVNKVKEMAREFVGANIQAETMARGLTAVYDSSEIAASQLEFLRKTAKDAGISVASISDSFVRFSAATESSNIPLATTNALFTAVTQAGATLGLSGERVTLVLDALGQMASKGVVSMEELRQQLGDSLPGALSRAAQGLGITDQQLIKLVESGKLATEDFFPALTKGLQDLQGANDTLAGSIGRFATALNTAAVTAGEAGWLDVLKGGMTALSGVVGALVVTVSGFFTLLMGGARQAAAFAGVLTGGGSLAEAFAAVQTEGEKALNSVGKTYDAFFDAETAAKANAVAVAQNAAAHAQSTSVLLNAAATQERLTGAIDKTGDSYIKQLVRLAENAKASEIATVASEKLLKAKEDEGRAAVQAAQLSGDEAKALVAQVAAAQSVVTVSESVVAARQREVDVTRATIAGIQAEGVVRGALSKNQEQLIANSEKLLSTQQAELEKAEQSTQVLRAQALAAQTLAATYADNATQVAAYAQVMESTRGSVTLLTEQVAEQTRALEALSIAQVAGLATQQEVDAARQKLKDTTGALTIAVGEAAAAERLHRDAVIDNVAAMEREAQMKAVLQSVTLAQTKVDQGHYEALAKEAEAAGNAALATEYRVSAKQKEIETIRIATQIKLLELNADKAAIEYQISKLDVQDVLYQKKKEELEIRLQVIKAKQIEAGASADVIKGLQAEIEALQNGANVRRVNTETVHADTAARRENTAAINEQAAAEEAAARARQRQATDNTGGFSLRQKEQAGTLSAADLQTAAAVLAASKTNLAMMQSNPTAFSLDGQRSAETSYQNALRIYERVKSEADREQQTQNKPTQNNTYKVQISLPNKGQTTINTASQSDAQALINMVKALTEAKGTAS